MNLTMNQSIWQEAQQAREAVGATGALQPNLRTPQAQIWKGAYSLNLVRLAYSLDKPHKFFMHGVNYVRVDHLRTSVLQIGSN